MLNIEIMAIVNTYTAKKEAADRARQDGKEPAELRLPAAVAWKRRMNMDRLFHAKGLIDEAMRELQKEYTSPDKSDECETEKGEMARRIKKELISEFVKAQEDILNQDTPVQIAKIRIEELEGLSLTESDMDTMAFMIEEVAE